MTPSQLCGFESFVRGFFLISKSFEWNSESFIPLNLFDSKSIKWIWELRGTFSHSFISKTIIPLVRDLECSFPDLIYVYIYRLAPDYQSVPEYTRVYQSVPKCTRVYQSVPECTRVMNLFLMPNRSDYYAALHHFYLW